MKRYFFRYVVEKGYCEPLFIKQQFKKDVINWSYINDVTSLGPVHT